MLQNSKNLKVRDSSIELLRIIAMLMIVFHHFAIHGGFEWQNAPIPLTRYWYNFIIMGGEIGVDVFVIISGYYLINDNSGCFNLKRIAKFIGQVLFYSIVIYLVFGLTGKHEVGIKTLIIALFPITFSQWWFASTYFVLLLLHPFLNTLLRGMDKSTYQKFLLLLVICWSLIPTVTTLSYQSNSLLWFVLLYSISGYIRIYGLHSKFTAKHYFIALLVCTFLTYISSVVFTILGMKWQFFAAYVTHFYGKETITVLLISLCLFMLFSTLKINYHRWINTIASATFVVYLIHDNYIVRSFLWISLFKNAKYQESLWLIPYSIIAVVIVYTVCTLIDLLRQQIIEKPFLIMIDRYSERITSFFEMHINHVLNIVFGKHN